MMKIKCLLAALAFSSIFCLPVQAHNDMETRHEVAVSYGTVPNSIWIAVFNTNKMDTYYKEVQSSHITRFYFSFLPSVKFNWLRRDNWGLYSKVAAGVTYANFNDEDYDDNGKKTGESASARDLLFNYQASLLGVEAGGQHLRGFAEFGIGEQGIALAGLRFKF